MGAAVHAINPGTCKVGTGRSLSSRPTWSTKRVPGQLGLQEDKEGGRGGEGRKEGKERKVEEE